MQAFSDPVVITYEINRLGRGAKYIQYWYHVSLTEMACTLTGRTCITLWTIVLCVSGVRNIYLDMNALVIVMNPAALTTRPSDSQTGQPANTRRPGVETRIKIEIM